MILLTISGSLNQPLATSHRQDEALAQTWFGRKTNLRITCKDDKYNVVQRLTPKSYVFGGIASNEQAVDELYILTLPSFQWTLVWLSLIFSSSLRLLIDLSRYIQRLFQTTLEAKRGCLVT